MDNTFQSGVKFRATPSQALRHLLNQWIGCQRVIYNAKCAEERYFASQRRLHLQGHPEADCKTPLDQQYAQFKTDLTPWLAEAPSQILRNGAFRWMSAKQRQLKGLSRSPTKKRAHGRQSVMITKELFRFVARDPNDPVKGHKLILGTSANPIGELPFVAHRPYQLPNTITIAREAGKWFVSFSYAVEAGEVLRNPDELAYEFNALSDAELAAITNGYDRGVAVPVADANGNFFHMDPVVLERIRRKETHARRYQRRMARQVQGSKNREKTKAKVASTRNYRARSTEDWAHKTSITVVSGDTKIHVLENLAISNMVKKPKARMENGKWVKNGARAKAGLNVAILRSGWGRMRQFTTYKAARRNQLVLTVPPYDTSNECSCCGHIHPDNRKTQAGFVCQRCGHAENADTNAAKVQKKRGIALLRRGIENRPVKRVAIRRKKDSAGPGAGCSGMSVERSGKTASGLTTLPTHAAMKQKSFGREPGGPGL